MSKRSRIEGDNCSENIETRGYFQDASVDPTDARRRAADRRSGGGERNLILWPHKGVPIPDHRPGGRPGRVTTSAVRVAAGGSRSGFPRLGTVSKRSDK